MIISQAIPTGILYLKPDLCDFLIKRENLDPKEPILDLNGRSVIKHELRSLCKTVSDLAYYDVNKNKYSTHIQFIPDKSMQKMGKIFLDGHSTAHFNRFLFHLRNELAHEYAETATSLMRKLSKKQSYQDFIKKYTLGNGEIDYEHLRRDVDRMNQPRKLVSQK